MSEDSKIYSEHKHAASLMSDGWLSPDGIYYRVFRLDHEAAAIELVARLGIKAPEGFDETMFNNRAGPILEELGWIKQMAEEWLSGGPFPSPQQDKFIRDWCALNASRGVELPFFLSAE